jgi:hypothetical protein
VTAAKSFDQEMFNAAYALTAVPARFALERRQWSEAAALTVQPATFPWSKFSYAEALVWFARGVGGARGGNPAAAREAVDKLTAIQKGLADAKNAYWAIQVEVQRRAAAAWLARAEKKDEEALGLLRSAADLEDSTEKHPVTPGSILPAREMLADLLLELDHPCGRARGIRGVAQGGARPLQRRLRGRARRREGRGPGQGARPVRAAGRAGESGRPAACGAPGRADVPGQREPLSMATALVEGRFRDTSLEPVREKVLRGQRLSFEDGVALYKSHDLLAVGHLGQPRPRAAPRRRGLLRLEHAHQPHQRLRRDPATSAPSPPRRARPAGLHAGPARRSSGT